MEKTTVLAKIRLTVNFTEESREWLHRFPDSWVSREDGSSFLSEFGGTWERVFLEVANHDVQDYFLKLGVPSNLLPFVQPGERYRGSWIMEAAVVMSASIGSSYVVLKGVSELPKIADGLVELKRRIQRRLEPLLDKAVRTQLIQTLNLSSPAQAVRTSSPVTAPPPKLLTTGLVIDARPLRSLTPALLKSHRVHLSAGVSRDMFTLENLGDETMHDIRLGLFRSRTQLNQWIYNDAYQGEVPLLSAKQTIAKRLGEFKDRNGNLLDMSDGEAAHVDCWVQDNHGIYLFQFYLERE